MRAGRTELLRRRRCQRWKQHVPDHDVSAVAASGELHGTIARSRRQPGKCNPQALALRLAHAGCSLGHVVSAAQNRSRGVAAHMPHVNGAVSPTGGEQRAASRQPRERQGLHVAAVSSKPPQQRAGGDVEQSNGTAGAASSSHARFDRRESKAHDRRVQQRPRWRGRVAGGAPQQYGAAAVARHAKLRAVRRSRQRSHLRGVAPQRAHAAQRASVPQPHGAVGAACDGKAPVRSSCRAYHVFSRSACAPVSTMCSRPGARKNATAWRRPRGTRRQP